MKGIISPGVWIYKFGIVYKFTIRKKLTELVEENALFLVSSAGCGDGEIS